ncbi:MAG: hypothetical protein KUG78_20965, partial [Kangiellaceae bacterium]|nr:hypothetical protein [Kangiellaceae bacterium]
MSDILNSRKRGSFYLISLCIIYVLAVMSFSPPIRALPFFNYLWPFLMMLWLFAVLLSNPRFFTKPDTHQLVTYLFFLYTIFIAFAAGNGFIGNRFLEYFQIFIFYWAYRFNEKNNRQADSVKLIIYLIPVVIITSVMTVMQYVTNPNISRTAKKDTAAGLEQMGQGVAGYEFIYFLVFLFGTLLFIATTKKIKLKFIEKTFLFGLLLLFVLNIALSNFMIALILVFISILFRVFIPKVTSQRILI